MTADPAPQPLHLSDQTPFPLVRVSPDWRYTEINQAAATLMGAPAESFLGRSLWDVYPAYEGRYRPLYEQAYREQRPVSFEMYYEPVNYWAVAHLWPSTHDVTVLFHAINAERQHADDLQFLLDTSRALSGCTNVADVKAVTVSRLQALPFVNAGAVLLDRGGRLELDQSFGYTQDVLAHWFHRAAHPLDVLGPLLDRREAAFCTCDELRTLKPDAVFNPGTHLIGLLPLTVQGRVLGGLSISLRQSASRDTTRLTLLESVAALAAQALAHAQEHDELLDYRCRATTVFNSLSEGIVLLDRDGVFRPLNPAAEDMLGHITDPRGGWIVQRSGRPMPEADWPLTRSLQHGERVTRHLMGVIDAQGATRWLSVNASPLYRTAELHPSAAVASFVDVTRQTQYEEELKRRALQDDLTGLLSRNAFLDHMDGAPRQGRAALAVVNLNRFRHVNELYGQPVGDAVLREIGQRLQTLSGPRMTFGRLSDDVFSVWITDLIGTAEAQVIVQSVLNLVAQPIAVGEHELHLSGTAGLTIAERGSSSSSLLRQAFTAVRRAQELDEPGLRVFDRAMGQAYERRLDLEQRLHQAVRNGEFQLHYQPIVALSSGEPRMLEALIRWQHPELGAVRPDEFIPMAEQTGLIHGLGRWVLREACHRAREHHLTVTVNVSPVQLNTPDFVEDVRAALRQAELEPTRLKLEITEGAVIRNLKQARRMLQRLTRLGVQVALDDFGTGYSSLASLRTLPLDTVKIDRAFVRDLERDPAQQATVRAIIALAHALELTVVAEGVETEGQRALLREMGCDCAQGYLLARPAPLEELTL